MITTLTDSLTFKGVDKDTGKFIFSYMRDNKEEIVEFANFNWEKWALSLEKSELDNYIKQLDFLDLEMSDHPSVNLVGFEVFWVGGKGIDNTVQKLLKAGKASQDVTNMFMGVCLRSKTEDTSVFITSQAVFVKNTPPLWYLDKTLILKYLTIHDQ